MRTGTDLLGRGYDLDRNRTGRVLARACATAPPGHKPLRVAAMATAGRDSHATTATTATIRFVVTAPRGRCIGPPDLSVRR